ncbi:MAG: NAD(+) synthase [Chitinivibrionales bacterium]|nr:NAD(+) synthase [Chitinivibrionales bacterium]
MATKFDPDVLTIAPEKELQKLSQFIIEQTARVYRRKGAVVGLSGGIDSAVIAAVCVHALSKDKVVGLVLPEKETNPVSCRFACAHAEAMGIEHKIVDITDTVASVFSYEERDSFIQSLVPEYSPGDKYNISLPVDLLERDAINFYNLQVKLPNGGLAKKRLNLAEFRTITSFANIKIRARMLHLYAEAERRSLVVAGTTNRTEFILGDFCKYGDGGTDIEPLSYLYKKQIYQLAEYLSVPPEIINRRPSPDTFSLPVSDQEFFFRIPFDKLDYLLYGWEHEIPAETVAGAIAISPEAGLRAYKDFSLKNRATAHLREMPHTIE